MTKTKHTPEPWKVVDKTEIWGDINNSVSGDFIAHRFLKEDARRIVACVNACKGFTTESLINCTSEDKPNWKLVIFAETKDGTKLTIYSDAYDKDLGELK